MLQGPSLFAVILLIAALWPRHVGQMSEQAKLTSGDPQADEHFGVSVAISGDSVAVGAPGDDEASGSAYVFQRSGTTWTQQAKVSASDAAAGDLFGAAIAISGDTVAVGAPGDDEASGSVYVFQRSGTTWTQQAKVSASDAARGDLFGAFIAISGDTVVVGCRRDDDAGEDSGSAYVFGRSGTTWPGRRN